MEIYYEGVVKAGIDTAEIEIAVNNKTRVITVSLPVAQIYDYYFNDQQVVSEKNNIFNPIEGDDVDKALQPILEEKVEEAIAGGLLDAAQDNAEVQISNLFQEFVIQGYTLKFD